MAGFGCPPRLPVAVYVEETTRIEGEKTVGLKAQTHFWGYSLKLPTRDSENVSVKVDDAVDNSQDSQDVGPLQASRAWVTQAENNVIDRLVEAGLVAPLNQDPNGYEHKILDQIVINLQVPNNLAFTDAIHTRVILTDTIETTTVGNTILISKGLIDSLPNEAAMASVVAMELAHIAMGHHIDTRYAFNDRLMFPDTATFQRIDMYHTDHDNAEAAKRAMEYLQNSLYKDQLPDAGLYYAQLVDREKRAQAVEYAQAGRFAAEARRHAVDGRAAAHVAQAQLGRPGAAPRQSARILAQDRPLGRQGTPAQRQDLRVHESARQDAVRGDADLLQAAALRCCCRGGSGGARSSGGRGSGNGCSSGCRSQRSGPWPTGSNAG